MTDPNYVLLREPHRVKLRRALDEGTVSGRKGLVSGSWCEALREAGLLACNPAEFENAPVHSPITYWPTKAALDWRA